MINNEELPIGFTMELAMQSDKLVEFSKLSKSQQDQLVDGARTMKSREAMHDYVSNMTFS